MASSSVSAGLELALFALLSLAGFGISLMLAFDYYKAKDSLSWPQVEGQVIASRSEKGCRRGSSYYPHIEYAYSVQGGQLSGSRLRFGSAPCGEQHAAEQIAAKYPPGAKLKVSVNPNNMFESVLSPGEVPSNAWFYFTAMALLFVVGSALTIKKLRA